MSKETLKTLCFSRSKYEEVKKFESLINSLVTQRTAELIIIQMNMAFELKLIFEKVNNQLYHIDCTNYKTSDTSIKDCNCVRYVGAHLPCFHIFGLRKFFNLPLFESNLIPKHFEKKTIKTSVIHQVTSKERPYFELNIHHTHQISLLPLEFIQIDIMANIMSKSGNELFSDQIEIIKILCDKFTEKNQNY
jgi:hypothetical protein